MVLGVPIFKHFRVILSFQVDLSSSGDLKTTTGEDTAVKVFDCHRCWKQFISESSLKIHLDQCKGNLAPLHSEWPKLHRVLAALSAIGLRIVISAFGVLCFFNLFALRMAKTLCSFCCSECNRVNGVSVKSRGYYVSKNCSMESCLQKNWAQASRQMGGWMSWGFRTL